MKRFLSIILAILLVVTTIPLAFAAGDGEKTILDIADGRIIFSESGVTQNGEEVPSDPDGYVITGQSYGQDSVLKFSNESDSPVCFDVTFRDLEITAGTYNTAIGLGGSGEITVNALLEGTNAVNTTHHPAFSNSAMSIDSYINLIFTEGASFTPHRDRAGYYTYVEEYRMTLTIDGKPAGGDGHLHEIDETDRNCQGYKCNLCDERVGEGDESCHISDEEQTCKGY